MRTPVPANSRRNIQRTRRAAKISVGIISADTTFRSVQSFSETASSRVFLLAFPNVSIADSGTPNSKRTFLFPSVCPVTAPMLTDRPSSTSESRTFFTRPFAYRSAATNGLTSIPPPSTTTASAGVIRSDTIQISAASRSRAPRSIHATAQSVANTRTTAK